MPAVADERAPATCEREIARLFEAHAHRLLVHCLRWTGGSRSDAEDAVQTTFLYALRALRRGVVPECESAWLTAIAKNVCHWQRRTLDRRVPLAGDADPDSLGGREWLAPEDGELRRALIAALASLPESQRRALVLSEWHGLSSGEVAAQLGMSTTATYALLTRARRSMAHSLTTGARRVALGLAVFVDELRSRCGALLGTSAVGRSLGTSAAVVVITAGGVSVVERGTLADRDTSRARAPRVVETKAVPEVRDARTETRDAEQRRTPLSGATERRGAAAAAPLAGRGAARTSPTEADAPDEREQVVDSASRDPAQGDGAQLESSQPLALLPEQLPAPPPLPTGLLPAASELAPTPSLPTAEPVPSLDPSALPALPDPHLPDGLP